MVTNNRFSFLLLLLVLNAVEGFGQPPSYVPLENLAVWNSLSEVSISAVQADVSNGAFVNDRFGASLEAFETFPSDGSVNVPNSAGGGLMFPLMFQNWFRRCSKRRKSVPIVSTLHKPGMHPVVWWRLGLRLCRRRSVHLCQRACARVCVCVFVCLGVCRTFDILHGIYVVCVVPLKYCTA